MFNQTRLADALTKYKEDFPSRWDDEKYKWEAVQNFQENWDIDASDFADMLSRALSKTENLLTSWNNLPKGMIEGFASAAPEEVRAMFVALFDENKDVIERILWFKDQSDMLLKKYGNGAGNHYQSENAISTYLWLRYPDKYYLYKFNEVKTAAEMLGYDHVFKKGAYADNLKYFYVFYDEICECIRDDAELIELVESNLDNSCYPDPEFKTLTMDVGFYISRFYPDEMKKSVAGVATGDEGIETVSYWIYSPGDGAAYWDEFYHKGIMAIGWRDIGDLRQYHTRAEMIQKMKECFGEEYSYINASLATWQFANEIKPGDIVFAKKGRSKIVGRGIVKSDYMFDQSLGELPNVRQVEWTDKGEWEHPGQAVMKTLTDITLYTDYVDKLNALFENDEKDDVERPEVLYPAYSVEDFLDEVYMDRNSYDALAGLVRNKKNVILQGAPGVGKTYAAKRLAYSMMGVKDVSRVTMVQFHQSYSYEDFIMGFRPTENGFELRTGVFYNFCKTAEADRENDYYFIIDEINRGNLSKIFGELFMLIENDKRDTPLQLLYANEKFSVPGNVYIIGMMNTADRSLAMLDYALRRRFSFFEMRPAFGSIGFQDYQAELGTIKFDRLINCIKELNDTIADDESLGEGFCIGHSYFCDLDEASDEALSAIIDYEIIPLLKEYWFDEPVNVATWSDRLRSAIK